MGQIYTNITVTHDSGVNLSSVTSAYNIGAAFDQENALRLSELFTDLAAGTKKGSYTVNQVDFDGVKASTTLVFGATDYGCAESDTIVLNGTTLTCVTSTTCANNQFALGDYPSESVINAASAITASTSSALAGLFTCYPYGANLKVEAKYVGTYGNAIGCYGTTNISPTGTSNKLASGTYHTGYSVGYITCATSTADESLTICGQAFTVKDIPTTGSYEVLSTTADAVSAAYYALTAIANATANVAGLSGLFTANQYGQYIQIVGAKVGAQGNDLTLAESGDSFTVSAAKTTSGAEPTDTTYNYGQ